MPRGSEFLTVQEVADLLKLNQQTIRNMIDRGERGHVRVGERRVRVRQSQLDAFLAAGESSPQSVEAWRSSRAGGRVGATGSRSRSGPSGGR